MFLQAGWRNDELSMTRDSTGIIMNYSAQARVPSLHRFDAPHQAPIREKEALAAGDEITIEA